VLGEKERHARALFEGIAPRYDGPAALLGLGQYGRWRRALADAIDVPPSGKVLDVATGTGSIARDIEGRHAVAVVGLDQSEPMLRAGRRRLVTAGTADALPYEDAAFDAVVFSYLLRYVPDPLATLRELARVLRPGGSLASVEFGIPQGRFTRLGWQAYARGLFPLLARIVSPGWRDVGRFLGPSIEAWDADWPLQRQVDAWHEAGIGEVDTRRLTFGTGVVMIGRKHGSRA